MAETFNFPFHRVAVQHPVEGTNLKLGGSWDYNSKPSSPAQRKFNLEFRALKYYGEAGNLDLVTDPEINFGKLEKFYTDHKQHTEFTYPHPIYGELMVKFFKPLEIPMGTVGGGGVVENITVSLVEQPT